METVVLGGGLVAVMLLIHNFVLSVKAYLNYRARTLFCFA